MNLKHNYWYFDSVLTNRFCDEVIRYANEKQEITALVGSKEKIKNKITEILKKFPEDIKLSQEELIKKHNIKVNNKLNDEELLDLKKQRDSNIVWLSEAWIYKEIQPYIHIANKNSNWNFDWNYSEACQFTKYKLNQHYDWHCDSWEEPYVSNDPKFNGRIRKLSVTCSLSDPKDYKGGEFEISHRNNLKDDQPSICNEIKNKGSIIVFPSFLWHRVRPVTEGTRYSLVIWNLGYPFR